MEDCPLLVLHGFTGNRDSFAHLLPLLHRKVLCPDLPGHAAAPPPARGPEGWRQTIATLGALCDAPRFDVLGYSQGARLALGLALAEPTRVRALVLESGSPGLKDAAARRARRQRDELLAKEIERDGIEAFVARWQAQPLFAAQDRLAPKVREALATRRLGHTASGLAAALLGLGLGVQPCYRRALLHLSSHVLLVSGDEDTKFTSIARSMHKKLSARAGALLTEHEIFAGCGHAPHLEAPAAYAAVVVRFLREASSA